MLDELEGLAAELALEISNLFEDADDNPCTCNIDENACPRCNAWCRARRDAKDAVLTALRAQEPPADVAEIVGRLTATRRELELRFTGALAENTVNALDVAATTITAQAAEIARLREALGQIAGKNDLSGAPDDEVESYARGALYDCELIARAALEGTDHG